MTTANLATLPGYYYLYALYFDYEINNRLHNAREHEQRIAAALREIAEPVRLTQPYRKTWALRLFTERESEARFRSELVSEAWRQLRELVDRIGPPVGWPSGADLKSPTGRAPSRRPAPPPEWTEPPPDKPAGPPESSSQDPPPRSPINYEFDA